jgi:hypothetical protein
MVTNTCPPAEMAAIRDPERGGRLRSKGVLPFETEGGEQVEGLTAAVSWRRPHEAVGAEERGSLCGPFLLERDRVKLMRSPPSLPGLTRQSILLRR